MYYKTLAGRVRYFKESKADVVVMCKAMGDMRNQTAKESMRKVPFNLLEEGTLSVEKIAKCCQFTVEEVEALKGGIEI